MDESIDGIERMNIKDELLYTEISALTFFDPLPGVVSSCSINIGGETASFVLMIGTMFKLLE